MTIGVRVSTSGGFLSVDGHALVQRVGQRLSRRAADEALALSRPNVPHDEDVLADSGRVEDTESGARVVYDAPYAAYVHGPMDGSAPGTAPHWPPWGEGSALAAWADRHGIPAFLVARHIAQYGTKQVPFLANAKDDLLAGPLAGMKRDALDELTQLLHGGGSQ